MLDISIWISETKYNVLTMPLVFVEVEKQLATPVLGNGLNYAWLSGTK